VYEDLIFNENNFEIEAPWPIAQLKFDKKGKKIIVLSQDGKFIFVYTTINFPGRDKPIQQFFLDKNPMTLSMVIEVIHWKFENEALLAKRQIRSFFEPDIQILLVTSTSGKVQMLRLISDMELHEQIKLSQADITTGKWLWNKIAPVMPSNITMSGPSIKVNITE
jgi:hypothetical protein